MLFGLDVRLQEAHHVKLDAFSAQLSFGSKFAFTCNASLLFEFLKKAGSLVVL